MKYRKIRTLRDICVDILLLSMRFAHDNLPEETFILQVEKLVTEALNIIKAGE